ncbi:MAG: Ig-like domain-containing protein [Caldilineaceae bacterium]
MRFSRTSTPLQGWLAVTLTLLPMLLLSVYLAGIHRHPSRTWSEQPIAALDTQIQTQSIVESSLAQTSSSYTLTLIAKTGDQGISNFGYEAGAEFVSINDEGKVAFVGRSANGQAIYVGDGNSSLISVTSPDGPPNGDRRFGPGLQMDNKDHIIVVYRNQGFPLRTVLSDWYAASPGTLTILARGVSNPEPFEQSDYNAIYGWPAISNFGHIVFSALNNPGTNDVLVAYGPNVERVFGLGTLMRPVVGTNGIVAVRTKTTSERILLYDYMNNMNLVKSLAVVGTDFNAVGHPGISDDGRIVTFYGDLTQTGANKLNTQQKVITYTTGVTLTMAPLTPGPGIFTGIKVENQWVIQRIASNDGNGQFDTFDEDDKLSRISVGVTQEEQQLATFAYSAHDGGRQGIYLSRLQYVGTDPLRPTAFSVITPTRLIEQNQQITQLSSVVQQLRLFDSINNVNPPEVAFWAKTVSGEAILRLSAPIPRIQIVDLYRALLTSNGDLVSDYEVLATKGDNRTGAATDGVTRVLLRTVVPDQGKVEFCLQGATVPEDGGLAELGNNSRSDCVKVNAVQTSRGYMAFAIYRTPDEFNRGGDQGLAERVIRFKATYQPNTPQEMVIERDFRLVRPPLLLMHGVWSGGETWGLPLINDPRWSKAIVIADYKATTASSLQTNVPVLAGWIYTTLNKSRRMLIATTQVDIIAHSMGGLISRVYIAKPDYKSRFRNYDEGDINRLITLNSPHAGSQWANLIKDIQQVPVIGSAFDEAMSSFLIDMPVDRGSSDLAVNSAAINSIPKTLVPSYAFVGSGGSEITENISSFEEEVDALELATGVSRAWPIVIINEFAELAGLVIDLSQGIDSTLKDEHDIIVPRKSQEGGMPTANYTVDYSVNSIHVFVTGKDSPYTTMLITLLNTAPDKPLFSNFPPPSTINIPVVNRLKPVQAAMLTELDELTITVPHSGTVVQSGETISVVVTIAPNTPITEVLLVGGKVALIDKAAPFVFELTIPKEALGEYKIISLGGGNGVFAKSGMVTLQVTTTNSLTALRLLPSDLTMFRQGETSRLFALGEYSDGIERNVSSSLIGTQYTSSDSSIVTVSSNGIVTAINPGEAIITVQNGSLQRQTTIIVSDEKFEPSANAGPDQRIVASNTVILNGSATFDLNNEYSTLSFAWSQKTGPTVTLTDATSDHPSFVPNQVGDYSFVLTVSDNEGNSSTDAITITVISAADNALQISSSDLTFNAKQGDNNPSPQPLKLNHSGVTSLTWTATLSPTWLHLSQTSGATPATLDVSVDTTGLAAGTHQGQIRFTGTGQSSPLLVNVTLVVNPAGGNSLLQVNSTALNYTAIVGTNNPAAQTLTISSSGAPAWNAIVSSSWIKLSATEGAGATNVQVTVDLANLVPSTHTGQITILSDVLDEPIVIDVQLTLVKAVLQVNPQTLAFSAIAGGASPTVQSFAIQSNATISWTASETIPWLKLTPTTGSVPATVNVTVESSNLAVGNYGDAIIINGTGAEPLSIQVTLQVSDNDNSSEQKVYLPNVTR